MTEKRNGKTLIDDEDWKLIDDAIADEANRSKLFIDWTKVAACLPEHLRSLGNKKLRDHYAQRECSKRKKQRQTEAAGTEVPRRPFDPIPTGAEVPIRPFASIPTAMYQPYLPTVVVASSSTSDGEFAVRFDQWKGMTTNMFDHIKEVEEQK